MAQAAARPQETERREPGETLKIALSYVVLGLITLAFVAPLLWMVSTSIKPNFQTTRFPPQWVPTQLSNEGYSALLGANSQAPVFRWFVNSMIAASAQTLLILLTASLAAYALARMSFPGKNLLFGAILATLFIPPVSLIVPNYLIVDMFGWLDTLYAVIVPGAAGAFGVFFLRQFFLSLPLEIEEAALIDGANRFQIFTRVILPLSKAPLATLAILSFLTNWNDFLWPLYVLFNAPNYTLQPALGILQSSYTTNYTIIMAGGVLATVLPLILYLFAQRYIIEGVSRSGLKG
ncbi:MAG: ABC transporter, permease protein 2 (cluster 1, maltose/g3p/polyamine/iron) [uncultured Rubrobacteraceae bacterium]|uniref:ABC transporter, permease protein 2 (Cluster 1, maltose/g3p/polyamine/iron) n=1 Tax=uncultured Rubrobacteraceae bacterium TaxID=349277 RepID=A0A6J4SKP8_9ACTN|nr:MAG: ABC transporter, permease protein 2 (cluster 1, maltose/g3p/polyamine/iron) [uncultured Rubrobacteraceae bacterium]